jgi:hypothetical protein
MDILFAIAVVGVWIAISVVALMRAYGARGPSLLQVPCTGPDSRPTHSKGEERPRVVGSAVDPKR